MRIVDEIYRKCYENKDKKVTFLPCETCPYRNTCYAEDEKQENNDDKH